MKLALCINNDASKQLRDILCVNLAYLYEKVYDDLIKIYDLRDPYHFVCVIDDKAFEKCFTPMISIKEAANIISKHLFNYTSAPHETKFVTGCIIPEQGTYCERPEYFIKFEDRKNTIIHITQRGSSCRNIYYCTDIYATILSDSQKLHNISFIRNLVPNEIEELAKTLKFLLT